MYHLFNHPKLNIKAIENKKLCQDCKNKFTIPQTSDREKCFKCIKEYLEDEKLKQLGDKNE
jgi:hypothetical protein